MFEKLYSRLIFSKSEIKIIVSLFLLLLAGLLSKHFINLNDNEILSTNTSDDSLFFNTENRNFVSSDTNIVRVDKVVNVNNSKNYVVNINTADENSLTGLPGIGIKTALLIIEYRNKHGYFSSPEELMAIKGIGINKMEKLKPLISVSK